MSRSQVTLHGVVLSSMPMGECDKRIVLLTNERGKIAAFAKGARRPTSSLTGATNPFVFGEFTFYEGRNSYNLNQASVTHYFADLAFAQPGIYYGYYFLELADYFGMEGNEDPDTVNLLYLTAKALLNSQISDRLVRCIFELRLLSIQGIMPQLFQCCSCRRDINGKEAYFSQEEHGIICTKCRDPEKAAKKISPSALYALQYIATVPVGNLYSFAVTDSVLRELEIVIHRYTRENTEKRFKSLQILEKMCRYEKSRT